MNKKIFFIVSFLGIIAVFIVPAIASASVLPFFGGLDDFMIPCTCDAALTWQFFAPLYYSAAAAPTTAGAPVVSAVGALVAPPAVAFSSYYIHPGTYALGTYIQGVQACFIGGEPYCYPLPSLGTISYMTGVSPTI